MADGADPNPWRAPESPLEDAARVRYCPNLECPHRAKHEQPAEYRDDVPKCPECGAELLEGSAPTQPTPSRSQPGQPPWQRLAVTVAAPFWVWATTRIPLPSVPRQVVEDLTEMNADLTMISIGAIGLTPLLWAFILVELAALVVPGWRSLRVGGRRGRAPLRTATLLLALVLCALQGWVFSVSLGALIDEPGLGFALFTLAILTAVTMSFWALAVAIDRYGLASGFSIVAGAAALPYAYGLVEALLAPGQLQSESGSAVIATLGPIVLVVIATRYLLSRAGAAWAGGATVRLPASGLVPLYLAASLLMMPNTLSAFDLGLEALAQELVPGSTVYLAADLTIALVLCLFFSWIFNRPRNIAAMLAGFSRADAPSPAPPDLQRHLTHGTLITAGYLALFVLGSALSLRFETRVALDLSLVAITTAIVMDVVREWRARTEHPDLVSVWPLHQLYGVDAAVNALSGAGIFAFPRGVCHRSMLQLFGPYVPVDLMVPAADAERATTLLSRALLPPAQVSP